MKEDRISQLCDDILLYLKPLRQRFSPKDGKTCGLSLTARHCCLNLKNSTIRSAFVSQLLSHRDAAAAVRDFQLSFDDRETHSYEVDREFMEESVLHTINHGVQSLRLHAPTKHKLRLELRQLRSSVKVPGRLS